MVAKYSTHHTNQKNVWQKELRVLDRTCGRLSLPIMGKTSRPFTTTVLRQNLSPFFFADHDAAGTAFESLCLILIPPDDFTVFALCLAYEEASTQQSYELLMGPGKL